jgi:hypothetical protein
LPPATIHEARSLEVSRAAPKSAPLIGVYAVAAATFLGRLALFTGLELYADEAY